MRGIISLGLRGAALALCGGGLLAAEDQTPAAAGDQTPAAAGELRVECDGVVTTTLAGQDFIYAGNSAFAWGKLSIRVGGQLHVFCGAGLRRTEQGGTKANFQIQSITANGGVTVTWQEGTTRHELRGNRLVIVPARGHDTGGSITLDGTPDANGKPAQGAVAWDDSKLRWQPAAKPAAKPDGK